MNSDERTSAIYKMWENGKSYKDKLGLTAQIPLNRDFYENRQWGTVKKGTEKLPRPQYAQVELIVNTKVANILSSPTKSQFFSKDNAESGNILTAFNETISKEIKEKEIRQDVVFSGAVDGNGFAHYFYNENKRNQRGEYEGGLDLEEIDFQDIVVSNPREPDIQKQDWIIVSKRVSVQEAKAECNDESRKQLIHSDEYSPKDNTDMENDDNELVTIYTRFFRIDNEVYFEKSTKYTLISEATALNPTINYNKEVKLRTADSNKEHDEDYSNKSAPDKIEVKLEEEQIIRQFSKYPIAKFTYKKRKGSFYGRSEVEPLINNAIAVNYNTAMMCLSVENQGWGTIVAREGALGVGSKLTNDPSKILIDKYKGQANGFYPLNKQPFSVQSLELNSDIMDKTKSFSGAADVITGEPDYKNQSGYAIAYLQQQAQKPIDLIVKNYHNFIKECEEIKLQFYLLYYDNKKFTVENSEQVSDADNQENATNELLFNGKEYINMDFNITVEVGAGTQFSELGGINMLDHLFAAGQITPKQYIKMYPQNILPNKNELLNIFEENENSEIQVLKAKLADTTQYLSQALNLLKEQNQRVYQAQKTIAENEKLRGQVTDIGGAYTETRNDAEQLARFVKQQENPIGN